MKNDLQQLMARESIDALWIVGSATHNPAMTYFTGNVHVGYGDLILIRGKEPVLFCNAMEREEAASTGLEVVVNAKYEFLKVLEASDGNLQLAGAKVLQMMLAELGFTKGRLAIYGKEDVGPILGKVKEAQQLMPEIEFIGEASDSILLEARATKDASEIDRIREMGRITTDVVRKTAVYLQECQVDAGQVLLNNEGNPLTIGEMKTKINLWLSEHSVENPEGTIFAIGRDAGIPHSAGNAEDLVRLGKTIIYDIFPREPGGGYFFDFTRTWCLGYAPEGEQQLYQDVKNVFDVIMDELQVDQPAPTFQERTCELFEEQGHATIRQDSQLQSGYVHSLGHGLGLDIHERPWFTKRGKTPDLLLPGSVVTIEPGLYYPEQGMGCRLEDSVWVRPDGVMEVLAPYPHDLVLPMKNWQPKG